MKDSAPDWILASLIASGAFIITFVIASFAFTAALLVSLLGFTGAALVFRTKRRLAAEKPADLDSALFEGKRKLEEIRSIGKRIRDTEIRAKIEAIGESVEKILAEVKRDPGDLKLARQFLSYYLDATINILNKYTTLSSQKLADSGINASLSRTEEMLDTINQAFGKQLARLLSNDVMDLDTELSLLEQTIRMEGLGEQ